MPGSDKSYWTYKEMYLIERIKQYPFLYELPKQKIHKEILNRAWEDVAEHAYMSYHYAFQTLKKFDGVPRCKGKWYEIRSSYAKIKSLIQKGKVSEEAIRQHPKTMKYMNGILNFMDPTVSYMSDSLIRSSVHKYFDEWLFKQSDIDKKMKSSSSRDVLVHDDVKELLELKEDEEDDLDENTMKYLMNIVENAVKDKMMAIKNINENSKCNESDNSNNLDEETCIEDDYQNILSPVEHILPDVGVTVNMEGSGDPLKKFLMKYNIKNNHVVDITEYMKDLADVLCLRLALEKRKYFLSRVDLIVSELFEG